MYPLKRMTFFGMLVLFQGLMVLTFSAESADAVGMFPLNINYEEAIHVVDVPSTGKVSDIRKAARQIQSMSSVLQHKWCFTFQEEELPDEKSLADSGISAESHLQVRIKTLNRCGCSQFSDLGHEWQNSCAALGCSGLCGRPGKCGCCRVRKLANHACIDFCEHLGCDGSCGRKGSGRFEDTPQTARHTGGRRRFCLQPRWIG